MFEDLFAALPPKQLHENFFSALDDEWMLITAGTPEKYNTMTASWGNTGILWNKPVAICYIRPQRYTFQFAEKSEHFTLSFLQPGNDGTLDFCGTHSGRDIDKARQTGLTPLATPAGNVTFEQSRLVLECRKLYADFLRPEHFTDETLIARHYPKKDLHKFYIGEIVGCWGRR
jgi:flavin reductase (DIM6/NTAB) family NADH-FMN oxidoreductase RutF